MEEIVDLIATDASAADISDRIKDMLYAKSAERIEGSKPLVANAVFNAEVPTEVDQELDAEEPTQDQE
jgi:hypothetical protein